MNIRTNIIEYLKDEKYVICFYDDKIYIHKYGTLKNFTNNMIHLEISNDLEITIKGSDLTIKKITEEELLINGFICSIEKRTNHE